MFRRPLRGTETNSEHVADLGVNSRVEGAPEAFGDYPVLILGRMISALRPPFRWVVNIEPYLLSVSGSILYQSRDLFRP